MLTVPSIGVFPSPLKLTFHDFSLFVTTLAQVNTPTAPGISGVAEVASPMLPIVPDGTHLRKDACSYNFNVHESNDRYFVPDSSSVPVDKLHMDGVATSFTRYVPPTATQIRFLVYDTNHRR